MIRDVGKARDDYWSLLAGDPPHERTDIAVQLGRPTGGEYPMDGFVTSYARTNQLDGRHPPATTFHSRESTPITSFFADEFLICRRAMRAP